MRSATKLKTGKDPAYLAFIANFPCVACLATASRTGEALRQTSRTEVAHVGAHGLSQKCPDSEVLPLCAIEHHREGTTSHHKLGACFWRYHGIDKDELIRGFQRLYREAA